MRNMLLSIVYRWGLEQLEMQFPIDQILLPVMFFFSVTYWDLKSKRIELNSYYIFIVRSALNFGSLISIELFNLKLFFSFSEFTRRSSINISDQWPSISFWIVQGCHGTGMAMRAARFFRKKVPLVSFLAWNCCIQEWSCQWEFQLTVLLDDPLTFVLSDSSSVDSGHGTVWSCLLLETSVEYNSSYSSLPPITFNIPLVS